MDKTDYKKLEKSYELVDTAYDMLIEIKDEEIRNSFRDELLILVENMQDALDANMPL